MGGLGPAPPHLPCYCSCWREPEPCTIAWGAGGSAPPAQPAPQPQDQAAPWRGRGGARPRELMRGGASTAARGALLPPGTGAQGAGEGDAPAGGCRATASRGSGPARHTGSCTLPPVRHVHRGGTAPWGDTPLPPGPHARWLTWACLRFRPGRPAFLMGVPGSCFSSLLWFSSGSSSPCEPETERMVTVPALGSTGSQARLRSCSALGSPAPRPHRTELRADGRLAGE